MPPADSFLAPGEYAEQLAAEQARRARAEAELAAAQARLAALEQGAGPVGPAGLLQGIQLTALLQTLHVGLVLVDPAGQIQFVNAHFWQLFNLSPPAQAPPFGPELVRISPAFADPAAFRARAWALHAAGQSVFGEEFLLADGRWVELDYLVLDATQSGRLICYRDVSSRHEHEQRLTGQRTFYENVLEEVPTPVAVFDSQHRYVFVNSSTEPDPEMRAWMLGRGSTECCARRQRPAAVARQREAAFAEARRQGRDVHWEETHPTPAGDRHLLMRYRPVPGPDGALQVISLGVDITEAKRAEQKIVVQQEFYESVLNLLPFDVAVFDAGQRFVFVNPAAIADPAVRQQVIGLTNAEYVALNPPDEQAARLLVQRQHYHELAVRTHAEVTWEEMRTDARGRPQLLVRHLRPVFGPDGALRLVVGTGIDITARYLAERLQTQVQETLREQEAFVRQVMDALPNVLYLVEPEGHISFANRAYEERLAGSTHLRPGPRPAAVEQELEAMQALNRQVLATGQPTVQEQSFTLDSGEVLHFQVHKQPLRRATGALGILTISTDITAVKRARQELERREKQYHDLVYYSQALICTHDLHGVVLSVNPAIEQLLGWPAAELVGRSLGEVLPPEHRPALLAYLAGMVPERTHDTLMTIRTRAGERRYLRYYSYRVSEAGAAPYVVASGYDVTAGVLARRALEQAKRDADANAQAKEAFLARISHEIRTPLNGVLGMAALLEKTPLSPTQAEYLGTMRHTGRHLLGLLNDVLDMAKITGRHLQLNPAPFAPAALLHGAGQAVAALASAQGLALVVELPAPAPPPVLGDAARLHQVLLNLLSNAIKFTPRGEVHLGAAVLATTPAALELRFWVTDTGIGIAAAEQAHIFEAFAQASADTSFRFGGTGLGLAISQQLVEQMGGTLALRSALGEGSTFSFQLTLPLAPPAAAAPAAAPAASFEGLRGLRVLLAEDNPVNQLIARVVLEHWGVRVQAVSTGPEALAQLREHVFDAAILDIRMPGLSGVEVTAALRADPDPARARLPIIALTANAFDADRDLYLAAGMNACLTKPYEEADLCQLLLELTQPSKPVL